MIPIQKETHTLELTTEEMMRLIFACNASIDSNKATLKHLPPESTVYKNYHHSVVTLEAIKRKAKQALGNDVEEV